MNIEFNFVCEQCGEKKTIELTEEGEQELTVRDLIDRVSDRLDGGLGIEWVRWLTKRYYNSGAVYCEECNKKYDYISKNKNAKRLLMKFFKTDEGKEVLNSLKYDYKPEDYLECATEWAFNFWFHAEDRCNKKFAEIVDEEIGIEKTKLVREKRKLGKLKKRIEEKEKLIEDLEKKEDDK